MFCVAATAHKVKHLHVRVILIHVGLDLMLAGGRCFPNLESGRFPENADQKVKASPPPHITPTPVLCCVCVCA